MAKIKTKRNWAREFSIKFASMPDKFKEIYMEYLYSAIVNEDARARVLVDVIGLPEYCESPIEQILWLTLNLYVLDFNKNYTFSEQEEIEVNGKIYRADFLYEEDSENPFKLIIECDGHDFHEKTKEQVEKRNNRDMDLKMSGFDVIHFSGSQIFNKPYSCAKEICDYIDKRIEEKKK